MADEKPAWWNDTSNFIYSRLDEGALMNYAKDGVWGRDRLGTQRWMLLKRFERDTAAPESAPQRYPDGPRIP